MPGQVISAKAWRAQYNDHEVIIGVDEVGRGAWAGPVMVGAVALRASDYPWAARLRDSKTLSPVKRQELSNLIALSHCPFDVGSVDNREIDRVHIDAATVAAAVWALTKLWVPSLRNAPVVLDGTPRSWPHLDDFLEARFTQWYYLEKADSIEPAVSAASIVAKVTRDQRMVEEAEMDGNRYDFRNNKGYGNGKHDVLLHEHGIGASHRLSFQPMKGLTSV